MTNRNNKKDHLLQINDDFNFKRNLRQNIKNQEVIDDDSLAFEGIDSKPKPISKKAEIAKREEELMKNKSYILSNNNSIFLQKDSTRRETKSIT